MTTSNINAYFAAAVYNADTADRKALSKFVEAQKLAQIRIGGILQEAIFCNEGKIAGLNAVDIATDRRVPITRPVQTEGDCAFDVNALAETADILRNAIRDRLDLVVVEKFGELEQNGSGLIDEILDTISEGIPLIIAVPEAALPVWQERCGELGDVLAFTESSFQQWWQQVENNRHS